MHPELRNYRYVPDSFTRQDCDSEVSHGVTLESKAWTMLSGATSIRVRVMDYFDQETKYNGYSTSW